MKTTRASVSPTAHSQIERATQYIFEPNVSSEVATPEAARPPQPLEDARGPLAPDLLDKLHRYWMAANYLTVGQIYLQENPLLRKPLAVDDIKRRLLGHWGTSAGLNFIYAHLNRLITQFDANVICVIGPGHGGPAANANTYLEGSYTEIHHPVTQDEAGMRLLFRQFSTPGGVPSHCGAHLPGSIHEGGELGYSLYHAYGAAFDNPDLIVACIIGDGEAETGPLEGSWKGNKFLNPVRDGAVLPILHLNGYKISGPSVYARIPEGELLSLFRGHGYAPIVVAGDNPAHMHQRFAAALDECYGSIRAIQGEARAHGFTSRPIWPMIILRSPKGWTGPKVVDGEPIEGTFRAHQVPLSHVRDNPDHLKLLEAWMREYKPDEQFDTQGRLAPELAALAPTGDRRMGANPHANGGRLTIELDLPNVTDYGLEIPGPGLVLGEAPRKLGEYLRDVIRMNPTNFRMFSPDETESNRLDAVFGATTRCSVGELVNIDDAVSPDGRVMEVLSEHSCEGWLEGYVLTGRHGMWSSYESFAQIVDSMLIQHAKWLKEAREQPWRRPVPSLNVLLTSHAWRQDHNGYSHQAPGFVDIALTQKSAITRAYFPPDGNCLLQVFDHCLRTRNYVNVISCGKQPQLQWLTMREARAHVSAGIGVWRFASNDEGGDPDVILACAGDVPTTETVAAAWLLRKYVPDLRLRLVNVVDLCRLMRADVHPHGIDDITFEGYFPRETPVIFVHHGYGTTVRSIVQGRPGDDRFHVRGYMNEGTTTTPFDMVVLNQIDRFHIAMDALRRASRLRARTIDVVNLLEGMLNEQRHNSHEQLVDLPSLTNWRWTADFSEPTEPPPLAHPTRLRSFTNA